LAGRTDDCEYYVVDNLRSCEEGRRIFAGESGINFLTDVADVSAADVVFMSGVLQYLANYSDVLRDLIRRFDPKLLILTLVPTGSFETFASAQVNLRGSSMPAWFFNRRELEDLVSRLGYRLVFRNAAELEFDMSEFPPSHRLDTMSNLVFARGTASMPSSAHE
jgi:putative methyltransferase (TIGR04325 family)